MHSPLHVCKALESAYRLFVARDGLQSATACCLKPLGLLVTDGKRWGRLFLICVVTLRPTAPTPCSWMAVGAVVCLREAAIHNRLSSDTYKRLNLGIMYWAVTMIVMQLRFQSVSNPALIT